jgi:hypothetical protein
MPAVSGLLTLGAGALGSNVGAGNTDEWVSEFQDTILVRNSRGLNAGTTLFGLMSKLRNEPSETTEFKWFERDPVTRQISIANGGTAYTDSTTSLVVDNGADANVNGLVQVGTVLRASTGELMRVSAVTPGSTSTTITVTRGFGDTNPIPAGGTSGNDSGAGVLDNNVLVIVTLGKDEGASPVSPVYESPTTLVNYVQTFNSAVHLTNAFKASKLRTDIEGPLRERRVQALERIARDIELAYFFGRKASVSGSNGRVWYTGGIVEAVDNIKGGAAAGVTTIAQRLNGGSGSGIALASFNDWLASILTVGSDAKLAFCGPKAYAAISNFANSASNGFRITGQETVFGMNITTINTPFGELSLAMHPLFKEISSYNDWMIVVDLALVVQKVMEPMFLEPNIQTPGADSYMEQFRAKYGLKLKFAEAFGYAYGLQKITAT